MAKAKQTEKKIARDKPISLTGPDFKELMKAFLKVDPEEEKEAKKKHTK